MSFWGAQRVCVGVWLGTGGEFLRATQQCENITARAHHKPPASSLHAMVRFRKWVLMQFLFSIISVFEYFGVQIPKKWSSTLYFIVSVKKYSNSYHRDSVSCS